MLELSFLTHGSSFSHTRAQSASLKYYYRLSVNFNLSYVLRRARSLKRSNLRSSIKVLDFFLISLSLLALSLLSLSLLSLSLSLLSLSLLPLSLLPLSLLSLS
jgi:hypothetical protein